MTACEILIHILTPNITVTSVTLQRGWQRQEFSHSWRVVNRAHTFLIAQPPRVNSSVSFPSTSPLQPQDRLLVVLWFIGLASKLIHMLIAAIQMSDLDCLLQPELWYFHRYFFRKILAEAGKRCPHLVLNTSRCRWCLPWGSFTSIKDGISL